MPLAVSRSLLRDSLVLGPLLATAIDLTGRSRMLDVGGGTGGYTAAFCEAYPGLRSTLLDLPGVIRSARRWLARSAVAERVEVVAGDFTRDHLPGGHDVVLASDVLHGQEAAEAERLVGACFDALEPGGLLVLRDVLMEPDGTAPAWAALFSLTLLTRSSSRCYREDEVHGWLAHAGFADVREVHVQSPAWDPNRVLLATRPG